MVGLVPDCAGAFVAVLGGVAGAADWACGNLDSWLLDTGVAVAGAAGFGAAVAGVGNFDSW